MQARRRDGKLVIVAAVQRLHPRHWDGHRLLQFLTGVALLVLAFGTSAASAAPVSPVATTVEAPAAAPVVSGGDEASAPARADRHSDECHHDASRVARSVPPAPAAAAPAAAAAPVQAAVARLAAGIAQQAHGSRAPPR